jgi:hypothetical protein
MDLLVTKKVIERIVPKFILDLNPVISGGFMLNLYMIQSLEHRRSIHLKTPGLNKPGYFFNEKLTEDQIFELVFNYDISSWKDIDIFFVKDEINQINDFRNGLLSKGIEESDYIKKRFTSLYDSSKDNELLKKTFVENMDRSISNKIMEIIKNKIASSDQSDDFIIKNLRQNIYVTCLPYDQFIMEDNLFFNFLDKFESNLAISYSTNLYIIKNHKDGRLKNIINALEYERYPTYGTNSSNQNSFDKKNYKIQFIKKVADDVNSIINNFDIAICSIAWHKDDVFFGDKFFDAINSEYLVMNDFSRLINLNIQNRFYSSKRMDKYSERYNKKFDKVSVEYLTMLAIDCLSIKDKNKSAHPDDEERMLMTDVFLKKLFKDKKISPKDNDFDITNYHVDKNSPQISTDSVVESYGIRRLKDLVISPYWNDSNNIYFLPFIDDSEVRYALEAGKKIDIFSDKKVANSPPSFLVDAIASK